MRRPASRGWKLAILLFVVAALAPFIYFFSITHISDGELTEKPVWVLLQGLAMDDSTNGRTGPLLHSDRDHGLLVLGVPGLGRAIDDQGSGPSSTRMWIVLNDHSASRTLRQTNRFAGYDLSCAYVGGLSRLVPYVDDYAVAYLRTICR